MVRDLQRELNHQFNKGLKVDGWFGDNTINVLVNVRRGAKGNLTKIIQLRLESKGYKCDMVQTVALDMKQRNGT